MRTLAFLFAMLSIGSLAAANDTCEELFRARSIPETPIYRPTVKIMGLEINEAGEEFFRLRKLLEESSWSSRFSARGFDPQGNPMAVFEILGFELARVLGFGWNAKGEILAPTPETMNRRIELFNEFLISEGNTPIRLRFYRQERPTIMSFLDGWSEGAAEPVAMKDGSQAIHDITFHYPNVLLPDAIVQLLQVHASMAREWRDFHWGPLTRAQAFYAASGIDSFSTSANVSEKRLTRPGDVERFAMLYFGNYLKARPDRIQRRIAAAGNISPLDIFVRRQRWANKGAPDSDTDIPDAAAAFYQAMLVKHPEWNRPLVDYDLGDGVGIAQRYNDRAKELRDAARRFLSVETP